MPSSTDQTTTQRSWKGKPVRHCETPKSLSGKLRIWRYVVLRRITQTLSLLLFLGSFHWGWSALGAPLLQGNYSASELAGTVPLADPFAVLQQLVSGHMLASEVLLGALIILVIYALAGGRVWCSWFCPINPVTDLAGWLRTRLEVRDSLQISRKVRYWVLGLTLLLSLLTGVAAFEWVSPIGMLHREVIFGLGMGWIMVLGVFLFDLLVIRHGWCGHLCPLGAFYALVGRIAPLRVRFDANKCTRCGDCPRICPEPQVLNFARMERDGGLVASGECSNCGRCTPVCPEDALYFDWRWHVARSTTSAPH
jgi:ferredoxin-type protein NapH